MRVLIVEDNAAFAEIVADRLARAGFDSDCMASAADAERAVAKLDYAAIILDLGLPDCDGLEVLRKLRRRGNFTPVLITTSRYGLGDRVRGLREGADAYLPKPFSIDELIARLHALLRRPGKLPAAMLSAGNVSLDVQRRQVNVGDRIQPVRLREALILELLIRHKGAVVTRRQIQDQLFGAEGAQDANTVGVYVHRLRKQLSDAGATLEVHTIRGVGYLLSEPKAGSHAELTIPSQ